MYGRVNLVYIMWKMLGTFRNLHEKAYEVKLLRVNISFVLVGKKGHNLQKISGSTVLIFEYKNDCKIS